MSEPTTFLDAVAQVEHRAECPSRMLGICCMCDRDARIAAGIEAMALVVFAVGNRKMAIAAFIRAASLPDSGVPERPVG